MALTPFRTILTLAQERKGGPEALARLVEAHQPLTVAQLSTVPDDRVLSLMTKCVFQAGFNWKVIEQKWQGFETAFHGFNPKGVAHLSPEQWDAYTVDTRIVRNATKIRSVLDNAHFVWRVSEEHGSFARRLAAWPASEQVDLMAWLKKDGSRLGGNTGMYFLRFIGKDSFIISADVTARLQASGLEIATIPSSKRDLRQVQDAFNAWHQETGLSYTALSRIAACSIGPNYPAQ